MTLALSPWQGLVPIATSSTRSQSVEDRLGWCSPRLGNCSSVMQYLVSTCSTLKRRWRRTESERLSSLRELNTPNYCLQTFKLMEKFTRFTTQLCWLRMTRQCTLLCPAPDSSSVMAFLRLFLTALVGWSPSTSAPRRRLCWLKTSILPTDSNSTRVKTF